MPTICDMAAADTGSEEETTLIRGRELTMCKRGQHEYASRAQHGASVAIIATTPGDELVVIEQRRASLKSRVLELPMTWVPAEGALTDSDLLRSARRCLAQHSGYLATSWRKLMTGPVAAGVCDELVTYYRARDLERMVRTRSLLEIDPEIQVHYVTRGSFDGFLTYRRSEGVLVDPVIFAAAWQAWNPIA